jgi:SP family general alpha glucoside:H+ symporter-like MFS transporter
MDDKPTTEHIVHAPDGKFAASKEDARAANQREHDLTVRQALRQHWKAVAWSLIVSMSIIMEGYDTSLISNFFAYPAFQHQFGKFYDNGDGWQVPGPWQSALGSGSTAGCIIGAFLNGYFVKYFGFKPTFLVSLVFMCGFVFISFFGKSVEMQTVGQVLCA